MKTLFLLACTLLLNAGCDTNAPKTGNMGADSSMPATASSTETLNYPYQLDGAYKDWQPGDKKNALLVMKMLKAWETKNKEACASYFGDSVTMAMDYFHKKVAHDSLPGMLEYSWSDFASIHIKMQDWESVISKDKKDEWVTLWYRQTWVDKKGKTDSIDIVNDAKIVNGKIAVFSETLQHFLLKNKMA